MEEQRRCPACGEAIPWGQTECPRCSKRGGFLWSLDRDTFLLLTFLALLVLFVVTGFAAKFYRAQEGSLAREWYSRGDAELTAGRAASAVEDLRTALTYSRENPQYRLRLAQALAAADRPDEARAYLLSLWESEPGNGTVNLELARLAVRQGFVPDAERYFHDAIYGEWDSHPSRRRREARLELAEFLLQAGAKAQAQAELIALVADLPPGSDLQTHVGELLLKTADYNQALSLFQRALTVQPHSVAALAGAGEACFELGNFLQAQRYLSRAVAENPGLAPAETLLKSTRLVLGVDPFLRGLSNEERARRALDDFAQAMGRLRDCAGRQGVSLETTAGQSELQQTYAQAIALKPKLRQYLLARDSELLMTTMEVVFGMERVTERACGEPRGLDWGLLLLARTEEGMRP